MILSRTPALNSVASASYVWIDMLERKHFTPFLIYPQIDAANLHAFNLKFIWYLMDRKLINQSHRTLSTKLDIGDINKTCVVILPGICSVEIKQIVTA